MKDIYKTEVNKHGSYYPNGPGTSWYTDTPKSTDTSHTVACQMTYMANLGYASGYKQAQEDIRTALGAAKDGK